MKKSLRFSAFVLSLLLLWTTDMKSAAMSTESSFKDSESTLIALANTHRRAARSATKQNRTKATRRASSRGKNVARVPARTHRVARISSKRSVATQHPRSTRRAVAKHSTRQRLAKTYKPHRTANRHYARASASKAKPKYAYAYDFFMWSAPTVTAAAMTKQQKQTVRESFKRGLAKDYSPAQLVASGIFDASEPLRGGIFNRRADIKYIILHSTETERPASGDRVIRSWNRGMRHPGAQYVVERNGKIYQTVDPSYGTVHVDIFRTVTGINNDNSIGIEIVRAGNQKYTRTQLDSITRLVTYLQSHYSVADARVYGHGQVQPSDRTDPVNFNWLAFENARSVLRTEARNGFGKQLQTALVSAQKSPAPAVKKERTDADTPTPIVEAIETKSIARWTLRFCQALFS